MPQSNYRGVSSFFDSPAGRALAQTAGGDDGGDVGLGPSGGLFAAMRPGLRNALADQYGRNQLDALERSHGSVVDLGPGISGETSRPFYVDPRIADAETARDQYRQNTTLENDLASDADAASLKRRADAGDYAAGLEDRRYWDPYAVGRREDEFGNKMRLATEPARIAAESRENVASTEGSSRLDTARATAGGRLSSEAIRSFDDWTKSGAFGVDAHGMPLPAPPEVSNFMQSLLGSAAGATSRPQSPDIEKEINKGVTAGYTRDEVLAYLRKIGRIQ